MQCWKFPLHRNLIHKLNIFYQGTASSVLTPSTLNGNLDKQNAGGQCSNKLSVGNSGAACNVPSLSQSNNIVEPNGCSDSGIIALKGGEVDVDGPTVLANGFTNSLDNRSINNGEDGGSGNSSRRESPPQNHSFQSLLVSLLVDNSSKSFTLIIILKCCRNKKY